MFWAHTEVLLSEDWFETLFRRQLLIFSSHFSHMFPTHPCSFELGYGQNRTLGGKRHKKSQHHFSEFFCNRLVLGSLAQEPPHWKWLLSSSLAATATMAPSPPPRILTTCRWKSRIVSNAYLCCLFSECGVHHIWIWRKVTRRLIVKECWQICRFGKKHETWVFSKPASPGICLLVILPPSIGRLTFGSGDPMTRASSEESCEYNIHYTVYMVYTIQCI